LQLIFRALRRAGVVVLHSQGHNPTPRVSFSDALPVGVESEAEYFDMELAAPLADPASFAAILTSELPPGMEVVNVAAQPAGSPAAFLASYEIILASPLTESQLRGIADFFARESMVVAQMRKGMRREVDVRPLVSMLQGQGQNLRLALVSIPGRPGISARAVLAEVVKLPGNQALLARIRKIKVVGQAAIP
jgi:radical SAM-linked protein